MVKIVTIKDKKILFKKEEKANAIELIELEEVGFEIVAQKNLYQIGDKAVLIYPDYNLSDISLFESYIRPNGDESKSMLGKIEGKPRRVRAKKFNFSKEPYGNLVYSNGILLPYNEVMEYISDSSKATALEFVDLTKELGITKYEEPEHTNKYGIKTGEGLRFPLNVYKTDEENINTLWNYLDKEIGYPLTLIGSEKVDGSSITIGSTLEIPEGFICSRNVRKRLTLKKVVGQKKLEWWEKVLFFIKPSLKKNTNLNIYEEVENNDDFVKHGLPYLKKLLSITKGLRYKYILRGELNGKGLKGSGNKNNPCSQEEPNIKFYGVDIVYNNDTIIKGSHRVFVAICKELQLSTVKHIFFKEFNSKEEILQECENYFKDNMIEGIVIKTPDSKFSAKIMNLEYDSKK